MPRVGCFTLIPGAVDFQPRTGHPQEFLWIGLATGGLRLVYALPPTLLQPTLPVPIGRLALFRPWTPAWHIRNNKYFTKPSWNRGGMTVASFVPIRLFGDETFGESGAAALATVEQSAFFT